MAGFRRIAALPRGRRRRFAPRVDLLETRALLSTIVVANNHDSGPGSLRQAIADAAGGGTIKFSPALRGQTITLSAASGPLDIAKNLSIDGPGAGQLAVSGGGATEDFNIASGASVTISGLTITGGSAVQGGGITNAGNLTLDDDAVDGNRVGGGYLAAGGGIYNTGTLTIKDSSISNDQAVGNTGSQYQPAGEAQGGGIFTQGGR